MEQTVQTIKIYNILRGKNFSEEEAEIMANAMTQSDNLATKDDLQVLRNDLHAVETTLRKEIHAVETSLRTEITTGLHSLQIKGVVMGAILFAAIIGTNPKALELISKLAGIAK